MRNQGLKRETISKMRNLASLLCKEAMGLGLMAVSYGQLVQLPKEDKTSQIPFSTHQLKLLWTAADAGDRDAMAVLVMCYTEMRPGELLGVEISAHIHTDVGCTYFPTGSKADAGRNRIIPIIELLKPIIVTLLNGRVSGPLVALHGGKAYRVDTWRNRHFNPLMTRLGIQGCTPYTGRHTYANLQKRRRIDAEIIMEVMGHEDYSTTVEHYHTTTEKDIAHIRSAVEGLERPA